MTARKASERVDREAGEHRSDDLDEAAAKKNGRAARARCDREPAQPRWVTRVFLREGTKPDARVLDRAASGGDVVEDAVDGGEAPEIDPEIFDPRHALNG